MKQDNYKKEILKLIKNKKILAVPGSVSKIHVYHDDDCGIFKGGVCNCHPDIVQEIRQKP